MQLCWRILETKMNLRRFRELYIDAHENRRTVFVFEEEQPILFSFLWQGC